MMTVDDSPPSKDMLVDAGGWHIQLHEHPPHGPARGGVILVHAMMAHSAYLSNLAAALAEAGFHCWRMDHRGHGTSTPHPPEGNWNFDDLVQLDHPAAVSAVRKILGDRPLWLVGHSLGGLTGIAAQGLNPGLYDGIVAVSTGVWGPHEPLWLYWLRRLIIELSATLARWCGRLPTRALGIGSDEALAYWQQYLGWLRRRSWDALDGTDYRLVAASVTVPVIGIRGTADRIVSAVDHRVPLCMPDAHFEEVAGADHFGVVSTGASRIVDLLDEAVPPLRAQSS